MSTHQIGMTTDMQSLKDALSRRFVELECDLPCEVLWHSTANAKPALVIPTVHVYQDESSFDAARDADSKHTRVIPLIALSVEATGATSRMEANSI